jgi:MFS transporter, DHA3 family, macrolide efflux protein
MSNYQKMLLSFFFSEFSFTIYFVTITWILYEQSSNALLTGMLVSMGFLPGLLLNLFFGVFVDRYNRKYLAITSHAISIFSMTLLFANNLLADLSIPLLISAHMLIQVAGSLLRPATQALLAELFKEEELPKVFSKTSSFTILGGIIGASIGGLLLATLGSTFTLTIVIIGYIIALTSLLVIPYRRVTSNKDTQKNSSILKELKSGFHYLTNNKFLLLLFVLMFNGQLVFHNTLGFLSVYTLEYLEQTATVYGFLDVSFSFGGVIAGLLGSWWWTYGKNKFPIYSLFIILLGLGTLGFSHYVFIAFIGVFLIGVGTTWIRTLLQAVQQMATDKNYHGRMASYRMVCNQSVVVLSGPLLGWIAQQFGSNMVYVSLMVPVTLCIVFGVFLSKHRTFKQFVNN